jgi:hypothetical protein
VPPAAAGARAPARWQARFARPVVGFGIAATVAVAAIVGLRSLNDSRLPPPRAAATAPAQSPLLARESVEVPPSYVVPQEVAETRPVTPPIRLTNYLMHHGEYASRLSRTSVHSNVVGTAELLPPDPTEATDVVRE